MAGTIGAGGGVNGNAVSANYPNWASLPTGHSDLKTVNGMDTPDFENPDTQVTHEGTYNGRSSYSASGSSTSYGVGPVTGSGMGGSSSGMGSRQFAGAAESLDDE